MFEGIPVEGLVGIGAFIGSMILLALVHGVSSAVQSAQASRREAARLVTELNALVSAVGRASTAPKGPGTLPSPRPVRRRRIRRGAARGPALTGPRQPYGPGSMARS